MKSTALMGQGYAVSSAPPKDGPRPAPANGRYVLSASQISTYASCRRKWAWRYIAGFKEPSGAAAELGGRVHSVLEAWLGSGVAPDRSTREGAIALAGLKHLPPPGSGHVEHGFLLHTPRNTYLGYIDFQYLSERREVTIIDHKTTSALKYAKTPEDLQVDIQALIYALFAFLAWGVDEATLMWVYYLTSSSPRSPQPTIAKVRLPVVLDHFQAVEALGEEISYHVLNKTHPLALPPNVETCGAYGGCPHQARCALSDEERARSVMINATMEQKLGMVPVFDPNNQQQPQQPTQQQQAFPQWTGQPQPQVQVPQQQQQPGPQMQIDNQGKVWYLNPADGNWYPKPEQQPPPLPQQQVQAPNFAPAVQTQAPVQSVQQATVPTVASSLPTFNQPATVAPAQGLNAPEGPSDPNLIKRGRGRPAGNKKLDKLDSSKIAFLAGGHAAVMAGIRDSAQIQAAGEALLVAFKSKFGE